MRPQSLTQAEIAVLSKMLQESKTVGPALTLVNEDDFEGVNRDIFAAIKALHFSGKTADPVTLSAKLGDDANEYLNAMQRSTAYSGSIREYCRALIDGNRLESAKELSAGVANAVTIQEAEAAIQDLAGLLSERKTMRQVDAGSAAMEFFARLEDKREREFLSWGFDSLDAALYSEPGDMIVLGGYPSAGKTALACQMALHQAKTKRVGIFSLETSSDKLVDRIMANLSGVELRRIKTRELIPTDYRALGNAAQRLSERQLSIYEASSASAQDIFAEALSKRLQIVYIDYLQLLKAKGTKGGNRYEEVTKISADLHTLAQTHKITVVALAQLSRPERKDGKAIVPTMQSFKESGQIEQDADVGLLLYLSDEKDYKSPRVLKIAKNKEGTRGKTELDFDGARQRFTEAFPENIARQKEPKKKREESAQIGLPF